MTEPRLASILDSPGPLSLYLHIPFCVKKCPYCDFVSGPVELARRRAHLRALEAEIRCSPWKGARVPTLFLGGGTPSELTVKELSSLVAAIGETFDLDPNREQTLECNPGTARPAKLESMLKLGFNRLSLGVQSFQDSHLRTLGRVHDAEEAVRSYRWARAGGFQDINLDLMFGLPHQTSAQWRSDLERALELAPEHLSLYHLTIEPGTGFAELQRRGDLPVAPEGLAAEMFELAMDLCQTAGYHHYEISNYALPGRECRHNQTYWRNGDYLGFGLSAASHVEGRRWVNTRDFSDYARGVAAGRVPHEVEEQLPARQAMGEEIMLRLRTAEGVDLEEMSSRYRLDAQALFERDLGFFQRQSLISRRQSRIQLTRRGKLLANEVAMAFL